MRVAARIRLSHAERTELEAYVSSQDGPGQRLAQRAQIVLLAAQGRQNKEIAEALGIGRLQVARWRQRYVQSGVAGIEQDLPRGAPPVKIDVARLVALTSEQDPATGRVWTTRSLAAELGVSAASVSRHRRSTGLAAEPARKPGASVESDLDRCHVELAGFHASPPEHTLVFTVGAQVAPRGDERGLPPASVTPGQLRNLAASLLSAVRRFDLALAADRASAPASRVASWLAFLAEAEQNTPADQVVWVLTDGHLTQQQPAVRQWLDDHPRVRLHLLPGGAALQRAVQRVLCHAPGERGRALAARVPQLVAALEAHARPEATRAASRDGATPAPFSWLAGSSRLPVNEGLAVQDISIASTETWQPAPTPADRAPLRWDVPTLSQPAGTWSEAEMAGSLGPMAPGSVLPRLSTRLLMPREGLMARLREARRQRCVVIQGQAGSGKTSTMLMWRKSLLSLGFDVGWLSVTPDDASPARFADGLFASIAEIDTALGRSSPLIACTGQDEAAIEGWMIGLVQGLGQRQRKLMLVIDDLHHIADPATWQVLQWLLDYAPSNVHVTLSSRSALSLSLERMRVQGTLAEFDMRDLRFTPEETECFLREKLGAISGREAAAVHALTDGWVAGLQLLAADLRTRKGGGDYPVAQVRNARAFAAYFEREVLVRLAPEDLDMLVRLSVCRRFCASLCAAVLQRPEDLLRIRTRLAELGGDNLFINPIGSHEQEGWYRIHPLLRETLLARLDQRPEAMQHALHASAWPWFEARGMVDDAVFHAVKAGNLAVAAGLVESRAHALLAGGELGQLAGLLRLLPEDHVQSRFELSVARATLQMYARDVGALRVSLDRMDAARAGLTARQGYKIDLLRAGLALQRDDADAVARLLPQLCSIPPDADDIDWTGRSNVLAWLFMSRGEYGKARHALEDAGRRRGAPRSSLLGRCLHAMSLGLEGQMKQAEKVVRAVLHDAERQGAACVGLAGMAAAQLADTLYEQNDCMAACQLLEPRIEALERVALPDNVLRAMLVLSSAYWATGRHEQASACLDRLEAYAVRNGLDRLLAEALVVRLRRHLQRDEIERAATVLDSVESLAARHAGTGGTLARKVSDAAARARIELYLHTRDFAAAAVRLPLLIGECEAGGRQLGTAGLRLQLALAQYGLGNEAGAHEQFAAAMRDGHRLGLLRTLIDMSAGAPKAFARLGGAEIADPVLAFYVRRVLTAAEEGPVRSGPPEQTLVTIEMLSEREREILDLLAQAMSNKRIATVLNVSTETVKWHLKNIYGKLGVSGRGGAAARLRDLMAGSS